MLRAHTVPIHKPPRPISHRGPLVLRDHDFQRYAKQEGSQKSESQTSVVPSCSEPTGQEPRYSGISSLDPILCLYPTSSGWLCCTNKKYHTRTRQWKKGLNYIAQFLKPLLADPPPQFSLAESDPQPCAYLLEILSYHKPNIVKSSRYFTFRVDGTVIKHTLEKGQWPSSERQKRLRYFKEMVARHSWRCSKHSSEHILSLYRPEVDQNFICCCSDVFKDLSLDISTYDRSHILQVSFYKWLDSLEKGQAYTMPDICPRTMFEIFKTPENLRSNPSKRYILFDPKKGIQELGKDGNLPYPNPNSMHVFQGNISRLELACENHANEYTIAAFELDDFDIFLTEGPAPKLRRSTPVSEYVVYFGSEEMRRRHAKEAFHRRPATPPKKWPGVIGGRRERGKIYG